MNRKFTTRLSAALGTVAFALMTGQPPIAAQSQTTPDPERQTPRPSTPSTQTAAPGTQTPRPSGGQQVTVTGCIQREADYRRSAGAGRGGAVGTGVGVGNEFILANAMMAREGASSSAANTGTPPSTTGTAGTTSNTAYELTGPNEGQAATHVGKRVEIAGMMKSTDTAPAGGATANVPGSQDLKLRELEITTIRETSGTCPATSNTTTP